MKHARQQITVFQQCGSGEGKIAGLRRYGQEQLRLQIVDIDQQLPPLLDDTSELLPSRLSTDLVLDFLPHPDLAYDLASLCSRLGIPVVASGKKHRVPGCICPPT
jgi:hypothetical protein